MTDLRQREPGVAIDIHMVIARLQGVLGDEGADEWAKLAAAGPDTHGVKWLSHHGKYGGRRMPIPASWAGGPVKQR